MMLVESATLRSSSGVISVVERSWLSLVGRPLLSSGLLQRILAEIYFGRIGKNEIVHENSSFITLRTVIMTVYAHIVKLGSNYRSTLSFAFFAIE